MLMPREIAVGFQQGSPTPSREFSPRHSLDVELLAEEQYRLGLAYLKSPQSTEKAVEHLEKAVALVGSNAEFHFRLAEAYARDFSFANILRKPFIATKMKSQLELAVRFAPSSIEFREALIQYLVLAPTVLGGSYSAAREQADALRKIDPYFGLLAYANINAEEGDHEKANSFYLRAIQVRPGSWQAYQRYGTYCLSIHEVDRAVQQFQKYVELSPDVSASYEHLAGAFVRKRMYDAAINAYLKAVEKDPALTQLIFRVAQLYEFKGSPREAMGYYSEYLKRSPNGRLSEDARTKLSELQ
jgi:tetratricopeptide (TPR) repeat protein